MPAPWEEFAAAQPSAAVAAKPPWEEFAAPAAPVQEDYGKLVPSAAARGVTSGLGIGGDVREYLAGKISQGSKALGYEIPQSTASSVLKLAPIPGAGSPTSEGLRKGVIEPISGPLYEPQTRTGKLVNAGIESVTNPVSYIGPGGALLKTGGALLSGLGGEAGRQATEGTRLEPYGQIAGALLGGTTAAKTMGPAAAKASTPTAAELKAAAVSGGKFGGYEGAAKSGLELDPAGVASWAQDAEQKLYGNRFSGGKNGTAPETFAALEDLAQPPAQAGARTFVGPTNIDAVRARLQDIAQKVQPTQGGAFVPTRDAAAASQALEHLAAYTENIPQSHVLAGDAAAYVRATKEANANYGAGARTGDYDARLTKAERATDRQIAGSLDAQIKAKAGQIIDRGARGLNDAERAQLGLIEAGGPVSNTLRQLGRGGAGVIPMAAHVVTALATGGGSIPLQLGIGIPLYAARKTSEAITKSRAAKLAEMLAQRSPEYESRVAALPNVDTSPNKAAIARALLGAF